MAGMLLSDEERVKFMQWLEQFADSNRAMLRAMEGKPTFAPVEALLKRETAAALIIAEKLRNTESMTIER